MRILQVGPIPPRWGGATTGGVATHLANLCENLVRRGHQVGVLTDNCSWRKPKTVATRNGLTVYSIGRLYQEIPARHALRSNLWSTVFRAKNHFGEFQNWKGLLQKLLAYQRIIESFKPEIIHVHHLEYRFPLAYYATLGRIPIITTVHSTHSFEFSNPYLEKLVQKNLNVAANLIFVSESVKTRYLTRFSQDIIASSPVIPNPVDSALFYPVSKATASQALNLLPSAPSILFVGNLVRRKGVHTLLEAGAILQDQNIDFHIYIVGDGPQKHELELLAAELALAPHVFFAGHREYPDLLHFYNLADLLVLPSSSEGSPLVVLEAMACGCPVVAAHESVTMVISSERVGYVCEATAPSIATQLKKALDTKWDRSHIVEHAQKFSWERMVLQFETAYGKVIEDEPS